MIQKRKKEERFREFLAEAEDLLDTLGKDIQRLEREMVCGIIDSRLLNSIFRSAHTLKGLSGLFDFKEMIRLSHALEDTLDMLRKGKIRFTVEIIDAIMMVYELLTRLVASGGKEDFSDDIKTVVSTLKKSVKSERRRPRKESESRLVDEGLFGSLAEYEEHRLRESLEAGRNIFAVRAAFTTASFDRDYEAFTKILKTAGELIATLPAAKGTDQDAMGLEILVATKRERADFEDMLGASRPDGCEVEELTLPDTVVRRGAPAPLRFADAARQTLRSITDTVRVDIGKLDSIMNVVGELSLLKTAMARLVSELKHDVTYSDYGLELARIERHLGRKLDELRDGVLATRMVPIGQLFSRFETVIRRFSRESGKDIKMVTHGGDTELDKLMVEELADPLMHVIRNAVDHGIELPHDRVGLGKPSAGVLNVGAYYKGNYVVVEVKDDGRGIDGAALKHRAVAKGLITRRTADAMSEREAMELIFLPGFSTVDVVSEVSGRGVGLDVVKENIARLSGVVDVSSVKGKGTRLIMVIPVTLAIVQALVVVDGGESYALPLSAVLEVVLIKPGQITMSDEGREVVAIDHKSFPCVRLSEFMGLPCAGPPSSPSDVLYGIVAGIAEYRICVLVSSIVQEMDVVIKPLSGGIKAIGIAGAADTGEGGTILVIDISGMAEMVFKEKKASSAESVH